MSQMFREDGHLTQEVLKALRCGTLTAAEKIEALAHIGECGECAERFAGSFEQSELLTLPPQFAEGVERKLSEVRITVTPFSMGKKKAEVPVKREPVKRDSRKEYRRYSCRVAIAACLALLLLFSGSFTMGMNALSNSRVLNPDLSRVNQLTQTLSDFSREFLHWEVKR